MKVLLVTFKTTLNKYLRSTATMRDHRSGSEYYSICTLDLVKEV